VSTKDPIHETLADLVAGHPMPAPEAFETMRRMLEGELDDAQIGALLAQLGQDDGDIGGLEVARGIAGDEEDMDARLAARRAQLEGEFAAMELALARLQEQSNALLSLQTNVASLLGT